MLLALQLAQGLELQELLPLVQGLALELLPPLSSSDTLFHDPACLLTAWSGLLLPAGRRPFPASSYKRPAYFTIRRSLFPFSYPGHFMMTDGSQRLMPGTKVISSSEIIMQR